MSAELADEGFYTMNHRWDQERKAVLATAQEMARRGLVVGSSGNVSLRFQEPSRDLLAITPTGRLYSGLEPQDIVVCDFQGEPIEGERTPSTEVLTHVAVYGARPEIQAVVHTHSLYATVAAVAGLEVPPLVDEMVVRVGGEVKVAEYAFPGTAELGQEVVAALGARSAVLLRNHGLASVGRALEEALDVAELVERMAHVFLMARVLGEVHPLPLDIVEQEVELYRRGQQTQP